MKVPTVTMAEELPNDERLSEGLQNQPDTTAALARIESVRQRMVVGPDPTTSELDEVVAPWFDSAVETWGKGLAYATQLGVSEQHLSMMRAGKKAAPIRALLPLLSSQPAVQRFCAPMCEAVQLVPPQPRARLTIGDAQVAALRMVMENPVFLKSLIEQMALMFGASSDETLRLLAGEKK